VHEADTEAERLAKLMSGPAESLASAAPSVPPSVCAIVDRALAFDRSNRYPDAAAMQADVRAARGEVPTSSSLGSTAGSAGTATVVPAGDPTREAATRAEPTAQDPTRRDAPTVAVTVAATVQSASPPPQENLNTERMPGAPAVPAYAPAPAPAPAPLAPGPEPSSPPASLLSSVLAPKNRRYLLIAGGLWLLGVVLVVAAFLVGRDERPDAGAVETPTASEPATTGAPPVTAVPSAAPERPTAPPATHVSPRPPPPPPRSTVHGR
jgi:serine/threonine-protein kinase